MWTKSSDLRKTYRSAGGPLNRSYTYANNAENAVICNLSIGGYHDGNYQISVEASSTETYNRLEKALIAAGFPKLDFIANGLKTINLATSDRNRLCHFLNAIKSEEPSFHIIELDVATSLGLTNLNPIEALSPWNKVGSFRETFHTGHRNLLNRVVDYTTNAENALIKESKLLGYSDNTYLFFLKLSADSKALKEALRNSGLHVSINEHDVRSPSARFCFNARNCTQFEQLLDVLGHQSTHFAEIKEQLVQHVLPVISSLGRTRLRHASNAIPGLSMNQQKLDSCHFSHDALTKEQEQYRCSLSDNVMSDPVYDPDFPQYQFERSWIERALESKKEHPFTQTPLRQAKLVSNTTLKKTIDSFVENIVSAKMNSKNTPK